MEINQAIFKIKKNSVIFYENESMAKHCSFKSGGPAKYYCEPKNKKALAEILKICKQNNINYYILGNGTNVLFFKFDGLVICLKQLRSIEQKDDILICDAGVSLFGLNMFAKDCSLCNLEWSYGIPGSIGGATVMNAGAYSHEIGEFIEKVEVFESGRFKTLKKDKLWFSYRESFFSKTNYVISRVYLKLKKCDSPLKIEEKMMEYFEKRKQKHPLDLASAGSMFKRDNDIIPAKIIDSLSLRGLCVNEACVSEKHAGFIVNKKNASPNDIEMLVNNVKEKVKKETGIELKQEVIFIR